MFNFIPAAKLLISAEKDITRLATPCLYSKKFNYNLNEYVIATEAKVRCEKRL
jgi:hypothetical protein